MSTKLEKSMQIMKKLRKHCEIEKDLYSELDHTIYTRFVDENKVLYEFFGEYFCDILEIECSLLHHQMRYSVYRNSEEYCRVYNSKLLESEADAKELVEEIEAYYKKLIKQNPKSKGFLFKYDRKNKLDCIEKGN